MYGFDVLHVKLYGRIEVVYVERYSFCFFLLLHPKCLCMCCFKKLKKQRLPAGIRTPHNSP